MVKTDEQKAKARAAWRKWYAANRDKHHKRVADWARANNPTPIEQRIVNRITDKDVAKQVILLLEAKFDLFNEDF